jgi:hypothetical protein
MHIEKFLPKALLQLSDGIAPRGIGRSLQNMYWKVPVAKSLDGPFF